jgi:hypothetical protein
VNNQRFVGGTIASIGAANMAAQGAPGNKMEWAMFSLNALVTLIGAIAALFKKE